jgi:hypothetical protein
VLDADIASCFDRIDHKALLEKINTSPHVARPIREWLKAGVVDNGICMPTEAGTPQGGVLTLPTKWQTFFFGVGLSLIRIDPKDDIDLILSHFHPLDQGTNHRTFAEPVGLFSTRIDLGSKVFQASNNQTKLGLESRLIKALLPWLLQSGATLS